SSLAPAQARTLVLRKNPQAAVYHSPGRSSPPRLQSKEEPSAMPPLWESHIEPSRQGKVRDIYDLGDRLVIVATDRISAFDWVLPTGIPDKGRVLTALTLFWLDQMRVPNHLVSTDVGEMGPAFAAQADVLRGRTMLVRKADVVPVECVVRGYLA